MSITQLSHARGRYLRHIITAEHSIPMLITSSLRRPFRRGEITMPGPTSANPSPLQIVKFAVYLAAAVFLASDECAFMTGQTLLADGGRTDYML